MLLVLLHSRKYAYQVHYYYIYICMKVHQLEVMSSFINNKRMPRNIMSSITIMRLSNIKRSMSSSSNSSSSVTSTAAAAAAAAATSTTFNGINQGSIWTHKGVRWIIAGWTAFITENVVLSENREWLIANAGDQVYHTVYSALSCLACGSIAYGYFAHGRGRGPRVPWNVSRPLPRLASFTFQALGLVGLLQLFPRAQMPLSLNNMETISAGVEVSQPQEKKKAFAVRCPVDFASSRPGGRDSGDADSDGMTGLNRVSRHGVFWSAAFLCLGSALATPFAAEFAMFVMPMAMATIGGAHQDSRFRRSMGGVLTPAMEAKSSHIPFFALLTGRQDWKALKNETKETNAIIAITAAVVFALKRGIR